MKNLFAAASYSFNNFYNNLNIQGQLVFSIIMLLILILCVLLFINYVAQGIKSKIKFKNLKKKTLIMANKDKIAPKEELVINDKNDSKSQKEPLYNEEKTEIEDIASAIGAALKEDPITLTNFEEDQEKTAIISIDELMEKAKELELIDDEEPSGVNYLEKYNLEPAEINVENKVPFNSNDKTEVKAFKVSQIISPIYGVKKEAINNNNN